MDRERGKAFHGPSAIRHDRVFTPPAPIRARAAMMVSAPDPPLPAMHRSDVRSHILFTILVLTAVVLGLLTLRALVDVWLLTFGGVLAAVALRGLGEGVIERTPLSAAPAIGVVCLAVLLVAVTVIAITGPAALDGLERLQERLPDALDRLRGLVGAYPRLERSLEGLSSTVSDGNLGSGLLGRVGDVFSTALGVFSSLVGALAGVFVVVIVAIYGALRPDAYTDALVAMLPERHESRAREVLARLAEALRWWLIGRGSSMLVVGLLTWFGLLALGIPSAGTLGLIAGLLSFVPNIGPVVSAVPAVLVGFVEGSGAALWVTGLYVAVQVVESYVVTPLIQQHVVALPPASVIVVQLAFGAAFGLLGLLFATPLAVVAMVLVQTLWIEGALGKERDPG